MIKKVFLFGVITIGLSFISCDKDELNIPSPKAEMEQDVFNRNPPPPPGTGVDCVWFATKMIWIDGPPPPGGGGNGPYGWYEEAQPLQVDEIESDCTNMVDEIVRYQNEPWRLDFNDGIAN